MSKNKIVIKIGTSTVVNEKGNLDIGFMYETASQIRKILKLGYEIVLISSGAIGCGIKVLDLETPPMADELSLKQLCASVGQVKLMNFWQKAFGEIFVSQHLITHSVFNHQKNLKDFQNCLFLALQKGLLPIINENDPVSTEEIDENFTDNDDLAVKVSIVIKAEKLIILSDINGLYDKNPKNNLDAKLIKQVQKIDDKILEMAVGKSLLGRGGMNSKLKAIDLAMKENIEVILTNGKQENIILDILNKNFIGTTFLGIKV